MNNTVVSLTLCVIALLASSLLQAPVVRANDVKPSEMSKVCSHEMRSSSITDQMDKAELVSDNIDGVETVLGPFGGAELALSRASDSSDPKLMQKPGNGHKQPCS